MSSSLVTTSLLLLAAFISTVHGQSGGCDDLNNPVYGKVEFPNGTLDSSDGKAIAVLLTCAHGYYLNDTSPVTCARNTISAPNAIACIRNTTCNSTGIGISNAKLEISSISEGAFAIVRCNAGYNLTGDGVSVCENGTWQQPTGSCVATCPTSLLVINGYFNTSGVHFGASARLSCSAGYNLTGNSTSTCQSNGTWSTPGSCQAVTCNSSFHFPNGIVHAARRRSMIDDIVVFQCNPGYQITPQTSNILYCGVNGEWNGTSPECEAMCPTSLLVMNGYFNTSGVHFGASARLSCNAGYNLTGNSNSTCQSNGTWSTPGCCQAVTCNSSFHFPNGIVQAARRRSMIDDIVVFQCNPGYQITPQTSNILYCGVNGEWNGTSPECKVRNCSSLDDPDNGTVSLSNRTVSAIATFACDEGYGLQGAANLTCQPSGEWSDRLPECIAIHCPLPELDDGQYSVTGTALNATARVVCDHGFVSQTGSEIGSCLSNATWSFTSTTCGSASPVAPNATTPPPLVTTAEGQTSWLEDSKTIVLIVIIAVLVVLLCIIVLASCRLRNAGRYTTGEKPNKNEFDLTDKGGGGGLSTKVKSLRSVLSKSPAPPDDLESALDTAPLAAQVADMENVSCNSKQNLAGAMEADTGAAVLNMTADEDLPLPDVDALAVTDGPDPAEPDTPAMDAATSAPTNGANVSNAGEVIPTPSKTADESTSGIPSDLPPGHDPSAPVSKGMNDPTSIAEAPPAASGQADLGANSKGPAVNTTSSAEQAAEKPDQSSEGKTAPSTEQPAEGKMDAPGNENP